jgi:PAS domain S-box-containing protein
MHKEALPGNGDIESPEGGSFPASHPGHGSLFEQCPTPLVVYDRNFRVVDCNEATARVFETTRDRIIGLRIEDMRDQRHRAALEAALAGETVSWESPYRATITDGWFWGSATFGPLRSAAGEIVGVIVALTSGTARVEESTRSCEFRLGESQRLGRVGSWIYDLRRNRAEGSPEFFRIVGVAAALLAWPHDLEKYIHPDERAFVRARIESVIGLQKPFALCEFHLVRPDGATRSVIMRGELKYATDGAPLMAWGTLQDVTERRALEEQLQHARHMEGLGQLAGGIAHDFNNILTVIQVEAGFLLEGLSANDPLNAEVAAIRRAAERAAALTRQLLAFSRKQILRPRLVHLNMLVTDTTNMLRRLIGEDIELVTQLTPDEAATLADPGQLEQVLVNLVINARDAMPKGGVLRIETSTLTIPPDDAVCPSGDYAVLTVSDTWHGMDESVRRRIFDPFFTTKPPGRGTGLGLSTVFGVVEQSGGKVRVESAPGRGARFTIYLPRATADSAPSDAQPARVPDSGRAPRATLLLVEDEPVLRSVSQRALENEGYTVLTAEDGFDALGVAETFSGVIDLLITDVVLPGLNGRALAARLRERRAELEVLYMTGYTDDEILRRGLMDDQVNLLDKPFNMDQLLYAARRAIRPG